MPLAAIAACPYCLLISMIINFDLWTCPISIESNLPISRFGPSMSIMNGISATWIVLLLIDMFARGGAFLAANRMRLLANVSACVLLGSLIKLIVAWRGAFV